jgi:hypothetical protein
MKRTIRPSEGEGVLPNSHRTNTAAALRSVATGNKSCSWIPKLTAHHGQWLSWTRERHGGGGTPERHFGCRAVLDPPVLMVDPVVLSNVEPHQP